MPAPKYTSGYIGEKRAINRLCGLDVWRRSWLEPVFKEEASALAADSAKSFVVRKTCHRHCDGLASSCWSLLRMALIHMPACGE